MNGAKNYTATDIERYHSGQLSASEMHALEKAALDDPFLADALEGYTFTQTPSADLDALQQRLRLRIDKEAKRRSLFYIGNKWMKIAALFVLMAGGGWLVLRLFNSGKAELATSQPAQNTPDIVTTESVADSAAVYSDAPLTTQTTATEKEKTPAQNRASERDATVLQAPVNKPIQIPPSAFGRFATDSLKDRVYAAREQAFLKEKKQESLYKNAEPATEAKRQADVSLARDTIKNFNVSLKRDTTGLSEVVVVGYGNQRRKAMAPRRASVVVDTLEPAEGWTNFDDYVTSNLKEPEALKTKKLKGEVELSFEVNSQGEPVNIAVTKPLCEQCDEEAVRLLKEGPKWKQSKKRGKVKIKFPLP